MLFIYTVGVEVDVDDDALQDKAVLDGIATDLGLQIEAGTGAEINGHAIESVNVDENQQSRLT